MCTCAGLPTKDATSTMAAELQSSLDLTNIMHNMSLKNRNFVLKF